MPEQAQDNPIYKFMKSNNLTQLDEKAFLDKYSAPEKAKEIHSFMVSNKLTDLDDTKFYDKYLKKKDQAVSLSVSSPTQSLSPDFKKGKELADKGFIKTEKLDPSQLVSQYKSPDISLSPKPKKNYYSDKLEKGLIFDKEGKLYEPSSEALTKAITSAQQIDLKKPTEKDLVEKSREMPVVEEPVEKQGWLLNTVSALDKGFYKNFISNPIKGLGTVLQGATKKVLGGTGEGFVSNSLIKFGDYLNNAIDELTPQDEEFKGSLTDQVAQAFGQVGSLIATGGIAGAGKGATSLLMSQAPKSAVAAAGKTLGSQLASPTAVSAGLSMGQAEFDRAIEAGANDDQAFESFYKNAAVGSVLETIPVMQFFKRFNNSTGGSVANYIKTKGVAGLTGGIEEMTTEVLQQIYSNKTAKDIYNINQEILDGVGTSGGIGFGVGFVLNAMGANAKILRKQGKVKEADALENQVKQYEDNLENPKVTSGNKVAAKDIVTQGVEVGTQKAVKNLDRDLANNVITTEQYQEGVVFAEKAAQVADKIPETVTGESRAKSIELLVERNDINQANQNLLQQKQATDVAYHAGIDQEIKTNEERIKKIDAEVYNIAKKPSKEFGGKKYIVDGEEVSQAEFEALQGKPVGTKEIIKAEVKPTEVEVTEEVKPTEVKPSEEKDYNTLYHNSSNENLKLEDIDLLRKGQSQLKRSMKDLPEELQPSGFYTTDDVMSRFMGGTNKYSFKFPKNAKVKDLAAEGRITDRLGKKELLDLRNQGYDIIKGKNMAGQQEFIPLNKDLIKDWKYEGPNIKKENGKYFYTKITPEGSVQIEVPQNIYESIEKNRYEQKEEVKTTEDIYFNKLQKSEKFDDNSSVSTYLGDDKGEKNIFYTLPNKGIISFKEIKNNTNRFSLTANAKNDKPLDIKNAFKRIEKFLPANHELIEDKSISVDGLRVWNNFIKNDKYIKTGETKEVEITPIDKTNLFKDLKYNTEGKWNGAKFENKDEALARLEKYLKNNNLNFKVKIDGDFIKVEVPVLKNNPSKEVQPTEVKEKVKTAKVAQPELAPTPKKEGVKEKKELFTTKSGRQKVEYEKGQLIVRDIKTGKEVSDATRKKAIDEYIDNFDFNKGERFTEVVSEMPSGLSDEEGKRFIIENSKNPLEVLETYAAEPKESKLTTEEQLIADYGLGKLTQKGFERFGDENLITGGMALTYFNKEGTPIDVRAKEMSDYYGKEITPQDIVNFMIAYPSGASQAVRMGETRVAREAAEKFKELTGIDLNSKSVEKIIDAEIAKAEAFEQEIIKQEYETREQLEAEYYKASEEADRLAEEGERATATPAKKVEKTTETELAKEYKEVIGKASKKAKENAKKDFVDRNFDNIVEKLKIQIKCPT